MVQKTINLSDYYASKDDVTDSKSGLMNSTQKKKLDEIEPKATRTIIEDNLESESTTKALSAAQGNLLNQKFSNYVTKDGNKQLSTYDFNQTYKDIVDSIPETIAQSIGNVSIFKVLGKDEPFPTDEDAVNHIYFRPNTIDESPNRYDVYVNVKGNWEKIDGFDYNITDYLTKTEANQTYATKQSVSDSYATKKHRHTGADIDNFPLANTSSDMIKMNGTKSAGDSSTTTYAKADHVHPSDDSKSDVRHNHDDRYLQTVPQHVDSNGKYGKATDTEWGHTKLSSTINADETVSATPKAVKTAYDLASLKANTIHSHDNYALIDHQHNSGAIYHDLTSNSLSNIEDFGTATSMSQSAINIGVNKKLGNINSDFEGVNEKFTNITKWIKVYKTSSKNGMFLEFFHNPILAINFVRINGTSTSGATSIDLNSIPESKKKYRPNNAVRFQCHDYEIICTIAADGTVSIRNPTGLSKGFSTYGGTLYIPAGMLSNPNNI